MSALILTPPERKELKAQAHTLNPVVWIGNQGVTPAVLQEVNRALDSHGLIKVKIAGADRQKREEAASDVAEALSCGVVNVIGNILILFRPRPE